MQKKHEYLQVYLESFNKSHINNQSNSNEYNTLSFKSVSNLYSQDLWGWSFNENEMLQMFHDTFLLQCQQHGRAFLVYEMKSKMP